MENSLTWGKLMNSLGPNLYIYKLIVGTVDIMHMGTAKPPLITAQLLFIVNGKKNLIQGKLQLSFFFFDYSNLTLTLSSL